MVPVTAVVLLRIFLASKAHTAFKKGRHVICMCREILGIHSGFHGPVTRRMLKYPRWNLDLNSTDQETEHTMKLHGDVNTLLLLNDTAGHHFWCRNAIFLPPADKSQKVAAPAGQSFQDGSKRVRAHAKQAISFTNRH